MSAPKLVPESKASAHSCPTVGAKIKDIQKGVATIYMVGGDEKELIALINRLVAIKAVVAKALVAVEGYFDANRSGDPLLGAHAFPNVKRVRKEREVKVGATKVDEADPDLDID